MNDIVCYTCITGQYDQLRQPKAINKNIDYVCFSDKLAIVQNVWKFKPIPLELKNLSNVKKQRIIKICPHRYLKEYKVSIWIDGNIEIQNDLSIFLKQYDLNAYPLYIRTHPCRNCIYDEAKACIRLRKDSLQSISKQIDAYKKDGYPMHIGLVESNIILRKHNDAKCILLDNLWASELLKYSHRDQLSFNYVCWKLHFQYGILKNDLKISKQHANTFKWFNHG